MPELLLALLLAAAAFIQLTVVARTEVHDPLQADAGQYFSYAWNLSHYGIYSSTFPPRNSEPSDTPPERDKVRAPGYPLFLLAVGTPQQTEQYLRRVAYVQALVGVGSVLLAYLIAASFLPRALALCAALLTAVSPHIAMTSAYVLSESLFTFLLLASTLATIRGAGSAKLVPAVVAGTLWGLCTLVRPTTQFLPLVLLAVVLARPSLGHLRRPAIALLLAFSAVLSPWLVRNAGVEQQGSSLAINSIAHGSYPDFMFEDNPETQGFPYRFDPGYAQLVSSPGALASGIGERFAEHPARYARWFLFGKPYVFLSLQDAQSTDIQIYPTDRNPYYEQPLFAWLRALTIASHWPLMVAALLGSLLAVAWRPIGAGDARTDLRLPAATVALVVFYAIAIHMVAAPFPRYAIPFRPLFYALAILPLFAAWQHWPRRARG